ncbi:LCP family protein [Paenarthrobacter sp. PH39-S1]|uniref:LCP family protein n=1 Tax=Paenarthrobacter sp. PH39-S1 TaxID=3046204 RepID=UPI0024B9466D|nr:LCP family protein [Paenarthrobacter sp. PH39-S1]MDJ0357489.1 LCP family protein [Paenarthrobacter sp. PH39-S1]
MARRRTQKGADAGRQGTPRTAAAGGAVAVTGTGRHFRAHRRATLWMKITALAVAVVMVGVVSVAGILVMRLQNNVQVAELNLGPGAGTAAAADNNKDDLQILILGTDTRDGANGGYGTSADATGYGHSDVMMLMNISKGNREVSVVSFPRDLMVPIPACKDPKTGEQYPAQELGQLNSALSQGGPGCTVAAINQLTGLNIDHFMLADFTAVKDLSNVIGGVEVCVDHSVNDVNGSGLVLPAGKSLVQGEQALAFLRTRHSFGDASDIARIQAQQYFLGSMIRKIKSDGTLSDLPKVYNIADAITKNLTIDSGLANIPSMVAIANRLKNIDLTKVAFVTAPWVPFPADENRNILSQPAASDLFTALRKGTDLTGGSSPSTSAPPAQPTTAPATAAAPVPAYDKTIQPVTVVNASGAADRNTELLAALTAAGYTDLGQSTAATAAATTISYGNGFQDVATDVAALFRIPASALVASPGVSGVRLNAGSDFASGTAYGQSALPPDIVASTADQSGKCLSVNPDMYPRE